MCCLRPPDDEKIRIQWHCGRAIRLGCRARFRPRDAGNQYSTSTVPTRTVLASRLLCTLQPALRPEPGGADCRATAGGAVQYSTVLVVTLRKWETYKETIKEKSTGAVLVPPVL